MTQKLSPWPHYDVDEIQAATSVLESGKVNYWTGTQCRQFEQQFAEFTNAEYAIAVANGTLALQLAFHAIGLSTGDEVLVTSRTFVASASSIALSGATPVFVDVDVDSQNVLVDDLTNKLTSRTKAILVVHLAGWPCDMDEIMAMAKRHDLYVIEDCAQAHGAKYKDRPVGGIGDIGCWSFCQDKIISTGGEGGMVTTNNERLYDVMWSFKDHGKNRHKILAPEKIKPVGFRYLHDTIGSNYRMTEFQAAIGIKQLAKLPGWSERRNSHQQKIWRALGQLPAVRVPEFRCKSCDCTQREQQACVHAAYKAYVFIIPESLSEGWTRDTILSALNDLGVPVLGGTCSEVYLEEAFTTLPAEQWPRLPNAQLLGETSLMFMIHPTLTDEEIDWVCEKTVSLLNDISL